MIRTKVCIFFLQQCPNTGACDTLRSRQHVQHFSSIPVPSPLCFSNLGERWFLWIQESPDFLSASLQSFPFKAGKPLYRDESSSASAYLHVGWKITSDLLQPSSLLLSLSTNLRYLFHGLQRPFLNCSLSICCIFPVDLLWIRTIWTTWKSRCHQWSLYLIWGPVEGSFVSMLMRGEGSLVTKGSKTENIFFSEKEGGRDLRVHWNELIWAWHKCRNAMQV